MKGHRLIADALAAHDIDCIFGVIGHGNMLIVDDLITAHGARYVNASREDGAVTMADGFARASGRIGLVSTTFGPGLTNTITGLTEASRNRTPLLLVVGDTPAEQRWHRQNIDHRAVTEPTGAGFHQVRSFATAWEDVAIAIRRCHDESRPIVLNIPEPLQHHVGDVEGVRPVRTQPVSQAVAPDPEALDQALGIIVSSKRPLVLAGRGAVASGAGEALLRLAEKLGAPTATTLPARGYLRRDSHYIGTFGSFSSQIASRVIAEADCIIAFGASLNPDTASKGVFLDGKKIVQCDTAPGTIGRWYDADAPVVGDARRVAETMIDWLDQSELAPSTFRSDNLREALENYSYADEFDDHSVDGTVDLRTAIIQLDEMLPPTRTISIDAGRFMVAPSMYLGVSEPESFLYPLAFGSVGLAMSAAIGGCVARPAQPSVAVLGDGGFMMSVQEFNTAVRHGLDLIVVVLNDGAYGAEYHALAAHQASPEISVNAWPDFAPVAESLGGIGMTVRSLADFETVKRRYEQRDRPMLVDVKVDPARLVGFAE